MRKIVLRLKKMPGRPEGLEITSKWGSRVKLSVSLPQVLEVPGDDKDDDAVLADWYLSRYSKFGLMCTVMNSVVDSVDGEVVSEKPVSSDSFVPVESASVKSLSSSSDRAVPMESVVTEKSSPENWDYRQLIKFARDHSIEVNGRAKQLYVDAVNAYLGH